MKFFMLLSLILNVLVLVPVTIGLLSDANWVQQAYGPSTPARGILLSIYGAILLVSVWQLVAREPKVVASLLLVQVIYKLTTPFSTGDLKNPVVISNLVIATLHAITLYAIRSGGKASPEPSAL
jgi:hypothetical protein